MDKVEVVKDCVLVSIGLIFLRRLLTGDAC